jgi:hypothetical protein
MRKAGRFGSLALFSSRISMHQLLARAAISGAACFVWLISSGPAQAIQWTSAEVGTLVSNGYYTVTFDHLPDGRFVLGSQNTLSVQTTFGSPASEVIPSTGVNFDPSFLSVAANGDALLGIGGFGGPSYVHKFTTDGVQAPALATLQNYSAVYRHSATVAHRGWLVGGTNAAGPKHNVTFVSLDGTKVGAVTADLCTYSSGISVDAAGALYVGLFELSDSPAAAEANVVLKFTGAQVESAIAAIVNASPAPLPRGASQFVYKFDGASSIAIDALGRVWAAGFSDPHIQVYDPNTGAVLVEEPNHGATEGFGPNAYQVKSFTQGGLNYMAFLASDLWVSEDSKVFHGYTQVDTVVIPNTTQSWGRFRFGSQVDVPALEASVWGALADPDRDGKSNLEEYAVGSNPNQADAVAPVTVTGVSAGAWTFQFDRDPLNQDLTYVVEVSDTMGSPAWTEIARSVKGAATAPTQGYQAVVSEEVVGTRRCVTVSDAISGARRFARLRIEVTP